MRGIMDQIEAEMTEMELKKAKDIAEEFTMRMLPKMLRELENVIETDEAFRKDAGVVVGKWLALSYAMGYMNCFEGKNLKKRILI
jgi:hypothetical protein